jgi:hypothetical protein
MSKTLIAALAAVLLVGVAACQKDRAEEDEVAVQSEKADTMRAQDDCPNCPGTQLARADGTCPICNKAVPAASR